MDFVTENIAIGDGVEAEDEEHLLELGITYVLNVHPMKMDYKKVNYARIPWHDENDLKRLEEALNFMDKALKAGGKVIVICGAGFERSPLTVFAYLHRRCGLSIEDALYVVRSRRPQSDLHLDWLGGWLSVTPEESMRLRRYF